MKWQIKRFDEVGSTNEIAMSFPAHSVIIAARQTKGRGRYGRKWESPTGNLYLSAVVNDFGKETPLLAFLAGVSVAEALAEFKVRLKWPNDVLLNGGKVAGILLERTDKNTIVIGIGINVANAPTEKMMYQTASLNNKITLADLETKLLKTMENNLDLFQNDRFDAIRKKWLSFAEGIGQKIQVHLPNQTLTGQFTQLSPQGELILETPDKVVHKISAGDVFLI